ncbi:uncharacterized protein BP01DRAFT_234948 [Aspergillus saccharolyticus JOP 1030-1]|uniref:Uncharacterized protein n=1 Tax=Aspergillus saccharolyticus JOP 1030-1 TaxID=1450539 RepID=A0A318Z189_9EURO|nr:hypothetical protein BP01DRAFT_234948 [Aspergillus saccharolyticus JOP 1030-1]PYH40067.1 hypothetical protein BP01DRAFT_234948 [Aspergillus saccharolyticus JOP 1030-1]
MHILFTACIIRDLDSQDSKAINQFCPSFFAISPFDQKEKFTLLLPYYPNPSLTSLTKRIQLVIGIMCTSLYVQYTCGCKKEMEFVQCTNRQGTNVKCKPVRKELGRESPNHCRGHLVIPDAPKKYFSDEELQD